DPHYRTSHRDAIGRAARGQGPTRPSSTALDDATAAAVDALIRLGGEDGTPGGELVSWHVHNAGVIYEHLTLYLDVPEPAATQMHEVLLDRFAVPFLGVTVGEHVEAYYAGVPDFPALPGVLLRTPPDRVP